MHVIKFYYEKIRKSIKIIKHRKKTLEFHQTIFLNDTVASEFHQTILLNDTVASSKQFSHFASIQTVGSLKYRANRDNVKNIF